MEERHLAAVELLGERDELVEEMEGDLAELRRLCKEQAEKLAATA